MKSVIRVQDSLGRGMFYSTIINGDELGVNKSIYYIDELRGLYNRHSDFPNLFDDDLLFHNSKVIGLDFSSDKDFDDPRLNPENWRFSFKNLNQFEQWVTRDEVKTLKEHGYRVFKISATEVLIGNAQNLFYIDSVIKQEDITDIFL